jgi:glycosyltransferase involved in cell wall biosynthesis
MKVVILSKALVVGAYQKKLEELARLPDLDLVVLVPPSWREPMVGEIRLERRFTQGYRMEVLPIVANGQHHLYFYLGLRRVLDRERPDVLHIDEESFNLATFLALRQGRALGIRCCFFNWANIERPYPPPFCWFERYTFHHAAYGIAGNHDAAIILRRRGYMGPLAILPQVGVDPDLFPQKERGLRAQPGHARNTNGDGVPGLLQRFKNLLVQPEPPDEMLPLSPQTEGFVVGYVGRLLERKGVLDLVEAVAKLPEHARLLLVGDGDLRPHIERQVRKLGIEHRVEMLPAVGSTEVPAVLHRLDVLVLPSRTTRSWKEQFGRILIEAMSCSVPVVGSSSGEIPNVVGDAGLIVPEGDVEALRAALDRLLNEPSLCDDLGRRGRARVLACYTQTALARSYYAIYREMVEQKQKEIPCPCPD